MSKIIKTAPGYTFHGTGMVDKHQSLFSVVEGIPMFDALTSASDMLSTVDDAIYSAAMHEQPLEGNNAWLVRHTLQSARAVIDSLIAALEDAEGDDAQPATE